MRRALSRPKGGAARLPAARRAELDHLRQRLAARLVERLPADWERREAPRRRSVPDATGAGANRFRERGRGDVYLREPALSRKQVARRRAEGASRACLVRAPATSQDD